MTAITILAFGTLGVGLRYLADLFLSIAAFPLSTFIVNIVGCFIAGWLFSSKIGLRTPLMIGLCGGLTTFSALMVQCLQMFRDGDYVKGFSYLILSQLCGLAAAWVGMKLNGG